MLVHNIKYVSYDESSTEQVQKPWCGRSNISRIRVERSNLTTSCYARIRPPKYIEKHNSFVDLPVSKQNRVSLGSTSSIFISQMLSRLQTHQRVLRKKTKKPSASTVKGKSIDGPFTRLKHVKCLIHT